MTRLATVQWQTPPPTSIDEELVAYDDGSAWLVVRRPASDAAAVGTFKTDISDDDRTKLASGGSEPFVIDLLHPPTDGHAAVVAQTAARVAEQARAHPYAVARFHCSALPGDSARPLTVALAVIGEGSVPVEFELDEGASAIHFTHGGAPVSWIEMPALQTGFITPEATGLGGLHGRAAVGPNQMGALPIPVDPPDGTGEVAIQVAGWLVEALPDAPMPQNFEARTLPTFVT